MSEKEGVLLVDKPQGKTSFSLIRSLRRLTGIQKIGHTGTLDPFATGVMVILVGRHYTRLSDKLLAKEKEYIAELHLGVSTDSYDCDGKIVARSKKKPSVSAIHEVIAHFQGILDQVPPMYSAKKVGGKKLYELARQGIEIERKPLKVEVHTQFLSYDYPYLQLQIGCSKGTYIRSIAHEIGEKLGCCAHLTKLKRTKNGPFELKQCLDGLLLEDPKFDVMPYIRELDHETYQLL